MLRRIVTAYLCAKRELHTTSRPEVVGDGVEEGWLCRLELERNRHRRIQAREVRHKARVKEGSCHPLRPCPHRTGFQVKRPDETSSRIRARAERGDMIGWGNIEERAESGCEMSTSRVRTRRACGIKAVKTGCRARAINFINSSNCHRTADRPTNEFEILKRKRTYNTYS